MVRLVVCVALICFIAPGCKEKKLGDEPGAACSPTEFCDQDKGLFCQEGQNVCACEGMFKWDAATKICAETEVAETLRNGEKKCRTGDNESCYKLGRLYLLGAHVAKEDGAAVNYFRAACEGGLQKACDAMIIRKENEVCSIYLKCDGKLGLMCDDADNRCKCVENTEWDRVKSSCEETDAARNFRANREKCAAEEMEGCHKLGKIYAAGAGIEKDDKKAAKLFKQACAAGYKASCNFCTLMGGCEEGGKAKNEGQGDSGAK